MVDAWRRVLLAREAVGEERVVEQAFERVSVIVTRQLTTVPKTWSGGY